MSYQLQTAYHDEADIDNLKSIVSVTTECVSNLLKKHKPISHLVCTGVSGQSITWPVANNLHMPVAVMRKPNEKNNTVDLKFIGKGCIEKYIIIDDLISSGDTLNRMINELKPHDAVCKAIVLWNCRKYSKRYHDGVPIYDIKDMWCQ